MASRHKSTPGIILSEIKELVKDDSLAAAKLCQSAITELEKGFRLVLYDILGGIYILGNLYHRDKIAYENFREDEFFDKCKQKTPTADDDHDAIILWVSRFAFRAADTESPRYNRAYKHARTLQRYAREEVPETEVPEKLQEEGADYVFRLETEEHPRRTKPEGGNGASRSNGKVNGALHRAGSTSSGENSSQQQPAMDGDDDEEAADDQEEMAGWLCKLETGPALARKFLGFRGRRIIIIIIADVPSTSKDLQIGVIQIEALKGSPK